VRPVSRDHLRRQSRRRAGLCGRRRAGTFQRLVFPVFPGPCRPARSRLARLDESPAMIRQTCLLAALSAVPAMAPAQAAPEDGELVVTATRQAAPADRLPYSVTLVGPDDLRAHESVAGALAELPEVYVQMPGGRGGFASLFLRGADPNFTSVMLEGVPLD